MNDEILRALRIKGRGQPEQLAAAVGADPDAVVDAVDTLMNDGLVEPTPIGYRLSVDGRDEAERCFAADRAEFSAEMMASIYRDFCEVNSSLKAVVTAWQLKPSEGDPVFNDHRDAVYDAGVLERLGDVHASIEPVLERLSVALPRVENYGARLAQALAAVNQGDTSFLAAPMKDSYHTVWFELHEELILLADRNRADEAAAGRAE